MDSSNTSDLDKHGHRSSHNRSGSKSRNSRSKASSVTSEEKTPSRDDSSPISHIHRGKGAYSDQDGPDNYPISELKDSSNPSSRGNSPRKSGRKNSSGPPPVALNAGSFSYTTTPPQISVSTSTLNPNVAGFHPGGLAPPGNHLGTISDMIDEGLVTPTASKFDLMTGQPKSSSAGSTSTFPGQQMRANAFHDMYSSESSKFSFPSQNRQNHASSNSQSQMHALNHQQQQQQQLLMQQLQMQQQFNNLSMNGMMPMLNMANMGNNMGLQMNRNMMNNHAPEMMNDQQMAIQMQIDNLLQQQEVMNRFGALHMPQNTIHEQSPQQQQQNAPNRRYNSHQHSGSMGSFTFPQNGQQPKGGHARRHSVNTSRGNSVSYSPEQGSSHFSAPSIGGFNNGFQFPGNGNKDNKRNQSMDFSSHQSSPSIGGGQYRHHRNSSSIGSTAGWSMNNSSVPHANLNDAQAHLSQLGAYRASSGHGRVPSFGLSSLSGANGGPGQLAMAGYGGGIPQNLPGQPVRKSLFAPYLPQASIPPLISAGRLVIGVLRVNKRNRSDAYVATDILDSDIYICGSKDRNRALEGDIVAVELLDVEEVWGAKKDKEDKKRRKEESTAFDPRAAREGRKLEKKQDDVEVEGQGLLLLPEEEVNDEQKPQYAGHVVAVVERAPGQLFTGMLGVLRPSSAATQQKQDAERREREGVDIRANAPTQPPKIIWFRPTDKRVPLIAIPTDQAPTGFIDHADKFADRLYVACIKRWPISSLHPFGTLVEELGVIGDIDTESNAILKDCNFSTEEFNENVTKCLPAMPWSIPEKEETPDQRRDFRSLNTFTIDPVDAKDLDDAIHISRKEDGNFEVGIHVADVSYFVKSNTSLDREARKRSTSVYLVHRRVEMLPSLLSEDLCSLVPNQDRLTFSVVFTLSPAGKVLDSWFGKSLINSKKQLTYQEAQKIIENRPSNSDAHIQESVRELAKLGAQIRANRLTLGGALKLDRVKIKIRLEDGKPVDCSRELKLASEEIIEEFMLMTNQAVARKIGGGLPEHSFLRRQEPPVERRMRAFVERMAKSGVTIDSTSTQTLTASFNQISDLETQAIVRHLATKSMSNAKYYCSGIVDISKYHHYGLNVPLYTHFTSPIRRYADILVHRQLESVLMGSNETRSALDIESISKIAQTCNSKREAANIAEEQSVHLYLCHLINDLTTRYGPVVRQAVIIGVLDEAIDVLVPEFGIEKRIHVNDLPLDNVSFDSATGSLTLAWKTDNVLQYLSDTQNDQNLQRLARAGVIHPTTQQAESESQLFDDSDEEEGVITSDDKKPVLDSVQHTQSAYPKQLVFEGVQQGSRVQIIRALQQMPVVVISDLSKSPPVLRIVAVSPFNH